MTCVYFNTTEIIPSLQSPVLLFRRNEGVVLVGNILSTLCSQHRFFALPSCFVKSHRIVPEPFPPSRVISGGLGDLLNRPFFKMATENSNTELKLKTHTSTRKNTFTSVTLQKFSISGVISAEKM